MAGMSENIVSNLAATSLGTNTPPRVSGSVGKALVPSPVESHAIDRVASWLALFAGIALAGLLIAGRDDLARLADGGDAWLLIALAVTLALLVAALAVRTIISPMIGNQLRELAEVAEAVAGGDLTKRSAAATEGGQLGRLARAMVAMTQELRDVAALLASTSAESSRLSTDITHGTEHMAQAASGIAETAGTLSEQASAMAGTIQHLTSDAARLSSVALTVTAGARDGTARNARLRTMASQNHDRLDDSARQLEELAAGVRESAEATESLAHATEQIRQFVVLVQKIARQSKLLALNAAMEAARAGEQGEGFAVVANEVRRLAASAAEAAEHTDALMKDVVSTMATARSTGAKTLVSVTEVQRATELGRGSFSQVESAVEEAEGWMSAIAESASAGSTLASEITRRLDSLTAGTQSFASAMQDVAAASEEQSASTQEIAAAAAHLTAAAERVQHATRSFRS
jgi:methyl-accepting chemotaxis protein